MPCLPCHWVQYDGSRLIQVFRDEYLAHCAIEPCYLDAVSAGIRPIQVSGNPVHSDAIRMVDLRGDHELGIATVQKGAADGLYLVICPVDVSVHWVVVNGDGVADVFGLENDVRKVRCVQRDAAQVCSPS